MSLFSRLKLWSTYGSVRLGLVIFIIVVIIKLVTGSSTNEEADLVAPKSIISLTTPAAYTGNQSISLIGKVRALEAADITPEQAGPITAVRVTLGQTVQAGQVIAVQENASERAAVLQAEGFYEAALAASAQTDISLDEAEADLETARNSAVSAFQSSYNTSNGIVLNSIDNFFANPNGHTPGLRIDGEGYTLTLNAERVAYQDLLTKWQNKAATISTTDDLKTELAYAKQNTQQTISLVDSFITVFNRQGDSSRYSDSELQGFIDDFTGLRSNLINQQSSLDSAMTRLDTAADAIRRADLNISGSTASAADAQIKQALGSLRSAQANLNKTILRTPISGTINSLSVRTGDFVNSFATLAKVANNEALEIVTYVNESERELFTITDEVTIEGEFVGQVTAIAPAVDSQTRKIEIRIATAGLDITNGDTVRITKEVVSLNDTKETVLVPLTAVKFASTDGFVFTIIDDKLAAQAVTLGSIHDDSVEIITGISFHDEFVVDARGLLADTEVTIKN